MQKIKLGEIAKIDISNVDKKSKDNETPVTLCNFVDVYYNWAITSSMIPFLMKATANINQIERFSIHKGQVAITKDSETRDDIGVATYIADEIPNGVLGYHCALITPDESVLNGKYLNVLLHSPYAQKYFAANASGSGQRYTLTTEIISGLPVILPDMETQQKIGKIFSDIDRKIENNNTINTELEAMAKTIYDYWFLQFEFPDENGKPYKSSGGKMVWNEELKRDIPDGWEPCHIRDCIKHINTGLNPRDNFKLGKGSIRYITVKNLTTNGTIDFTSCDVIDEEARAIVHRRSDVSKGDILFASIAPLGRCVIVQENPIDWDINESVFSIRPDTNKVSTEHLYMFFMSDYFIKKAEHNSTGSVFSGIRVGTLEDMYILLPPPAIRDKFKSAVADILYKKYLNDQENQELASLRDFLLPLLMNGQVTFGDR